MSFQIRKIKLDDLSQCLKLLKQLSDIGKGCDYESIYRKIESDPNIFIYVCVLNNNIVGIATIFLEQKLIHCHHSSGKVGHIEDVVVDKNHRKKGIGKALIEKCINRGKKHKCYKIILNCTEDNAPFYFKAGFKRYEICLRLDLQ